MVLAAFLDAPETKKLRKFFLDLKVHTLVWAKSLQKPLNSQLLLWIWAQSHFTCCLGALLFLVNGNHFWYYCSISGALLTYTLMVFRHLYVLANGFRQTDDGTPLSWVIYSENFTLCSMAMLHLLTFPRAAKTATFTIFAVLNLSTFVVQKFGSESLNRVFMPIIYHIEPTILTAAVYADLVACLVYVYDFLFGQSTFLSAVFFAVILLYRFEQSPVALMSVHIILDRALRITAGFESANRSVLVAKKCLTALLPPDARTGAPQTESGSVHTRSRAASSVFRPVEIIKDV